MKCTKCGRQKDKTNFYDTHSTGQCKECIRLRMKLYGRKLRLNPILKEKERLKIKKWKRDNLDHVRLLSRKWWRSLRLEVLAAYGGAKPICKCCGEDMEEFLAIDHINGGGSKQLKELKKRGSSFYTWLKQNKFPKGFQILCHNCNFAKSRYNGCPHKRKV